MMVGQGGPGSTPALLRFGALKKPHFLPHFLPLTALKTVYSILRRNPQSIENTRLF